jgi:hypothetical protein
VKTRRHHNNKGVRQVRRGRTVEQVKRIARRVGVPFNAEAQRSKGAEVLHLTLMRHWFVRIMRGLKKREYRRATAYWRQRLCGRVYREVHFRNGYSKDSPFMRVEFRGVREYRFKPGCGGLFIIRLGKVLEVRNAP